MEPGDVAWKTRVVGELRGEDAGGHAHVRASAVRAVMLVVDVEAGGGGQIARLLPVEDHLRVDEPAVLQVEGDSRAPELLEQDVQVEAADVEPGQIAPLQQAGQAACPAPEGSLAGDIGVADAVDRGGLGGDGFFRVEAADPVHHPAIGIQDEQRQFDDAVLASVQTGGFEVEEGQGTGQTDGEGRIHGRWVRGFGGAGPNLRRLVRPRPIPGAFESGSRRAGMPDWRRGMCGSPETTARRPEYGDA